ncbi:MAG: hypothetical protein HQL95_11675 [Magnetococcales bacterium]|nr:hypothetical protein [Magnetococcales bacterium]
MMGLMVMVMGGMLYTGGNVSTHAGPYPQPVPAYGRKLEDVINTPRMIRNGTMEPTETEKLEKAEETLDVLRRNGKLGHDHRDGIHSGSTHVGPYSQPVPQYGRKLEDVINTPRLIHSDGTMEPTETEKLEKAEETLKVLRRNGKLGNDHRSGTRSEYGYDRSRDWDAGD